MVVLKRAGHLPSLGSARRAPWPESPAHKKMMSHPSEEPCAPCCTISSTQFARMTVAAPAAPGGKLARSKATALRVVSRWEVVNNRGGRVPFSPASPQGLRRPTDLGSRAPTPSTRTWRRDPIPLIVPSCAPNPLALPSRRVSNEPPQFIERPFPIRPFAWPKGPGLPVGDFVLQR
jgi:hypothetical protein